MKQRPKLIRPGRKGRPENREARQRRRRMDRQLIRGLDQNPAAAKWDLFGVAKPKRRKRPTTA